MIGDGFADQPVRELGMAARAPSIRRGVTRFFAASGAVVLVELPLANGRRADVVALSGQGELVVVEIKSGPADLRADHKWRSYLEFADRFYFAVDADFPLGLLPADVGILVADAFDAVVQREARASPLAAARRKAMTLRFARTAAQRLLTLTDPAAGPG